MIEGIPDELLSNCFSFIDFYERSAVFLTNKRLNRTCFLDIPSDSFDVVFCESFRGDKEIINDYLKGSSRKISESTVCLS